MDGTITTFISEKGYGFIKGEDGKDYYFRREFFANREQYADILDGNAVAFEPFATPKGYQAKKCVMPDISTIETYIAPDEVLTSKDGNIRGWKIMEQADWTLKGEDSGLDDARKLLVERAKSLGANAIIKLEHSKSTGSTSSNSGHGTYYFTIHCFTGIPVSIAKKSPNGNLFRKNFSGLNERLQTKHQELKSLENKSMSRSMLILVASLITSITIWKIYSILAAILFFLVSLAVAMKIGVRSNCDWIQPLINKS